jgi:Protein of unknown function (DUF2799)
MYPALPVVRFAALLVPLSLAAWLSGCASGLSKEECDAADWRAIGYEDGIKGWSQTRLSTHRKACAKHGVSLVLDDYLKGWQAGVEQYCQPANGYRQGRSGAGYQGVCPAQLEPGFMQAYRSGRELYALEKDVQRLGHAVNTSHNRMADLEVAIRDAGLELVAPDVSTARRVVLLDEVRKMEAEYSDLRDHRIPELENQLAMQQSNLAQMRAEHQY